MPDPTPTPELKNALGRFAADVAQVQEAARRVAAGTAAPAPGTRLPSAALLRFHQALLVFASALLSALLIGFPSAGTIKTTVGGYGGEQLYAHTMAYLTGMIAIAGVLAFLAQILQESIDRKGFSAANIMLWLFGLLTAAALGCGIAAAWPFLADMAARAGW